MKYLIYIWYIIFRSCVNFVLLRSFHVFWQSCAGRDGLALHLTTLADNCVDLASAASSSALGHSHGSATTLLLWPRMCLLLRWPSHVPAGECAELLGASERACSIWLSLKNMCGPITLVRQKMKKVRRKILTCSSIMSVRQKRRKRFYQRTNGVPQCSKVF